MFDDLGINTDILIIVMIIFILIMIVMIMTLTLRVSRLSKSYTKYMAGSNGKSLEATFHEKFDKVDELSEDFAEYKARILKLENNKNAGFCKFAVRKYDAFKDVRGKMSFSVCLLDDADDGFILTGMHNSDGSYTYLKEIIKGNPITKLSAEEQKVLDSAKVCNDPVAEVKNQVQVPERKGLSRKAEELLGDLTGDKAKKKEETEKD